MRYFAIGDIHGEWQKLSVLMEILVREAGFKAGTDMLVQLGDKNDRGPDSYAVYEHFRLMKLAHPDHVICLYGNHEDLMVRAAKNWRDDYNLFQLNGGSKTERSYSQQTQLYGRSHLGEMLLKTKHWEFLQEHDTFSEDDSYFFSHAPIPRPEFRHMDGVYDFRNHLNTLIWSFHGEDLHNWVDPDPCKGKICVYGHIHGMKSCGGMGYSNNVSIPGVRTIGNAYLIDTGCGCHPEGYLTALELPAKKVYTSRGESYNVY